MRAERRRNKKLTVAFHFQFARQAAWKCDTCRQQGLEQKRRCGYLGLQNEQPERLVWARGGVRLTTCPKSYIRPESLEWLERYQTGRVFGFGDVMSMPARVVDAFCVIENLIAAEKSNDEG